MLSIVFKDSVGLQLSAPSWTEIALSASMVSAFLHRASGTSLCARQNPGTRTFAVTWDEHAPCLPAG